MWQKWFVVFLLTVKCGCETTFTNDTVPPSVDTTTTRNIAESTVATIEQSTHLNISDLNLTSKEETAEADVTKYVFSKLDDGNNNETALMAISEMKSKFEEYFKEKEMRVRDRDIRLLDKKVKSYIEKISKLKQNEVASAKSVMKTMKLIKTDVPLETLLFIFQSNELSRLFFDEVDNIVSYLKDLSAWYEFITYFYVRLSEYEVQKDNKICILDDKVVIREWDKKKVSNTNIHEYLRRCLRDGFQEKYESIQNITLDAFKIETVIHVVNYMTEDDSDILNSIIRNELLITKRFVKTSILSQIPADKFASLKSITLMALNKIFIDGSITMISDDRAQLHIISPVWEVIGQSVINLNGKELTQEDFTDTQSKDGIGEPGRNGNTAGTFFGIGETIINSENLTISAIGSDGGTGQSGRNGRDGEDGDIISDNFNGNETINAWINKGYNVTVSNSTNCLVSNNSCYIVRAKGKDCTDGENGAVGGYGGYGGKAGIVALIDFSDLSRIKIKHEAGRLGMPGRSGINGLSGISGNMAFFKVTIPDQVVIEKSFRDGKICQYGSWEFPDKDHVREQPKEPRKIRAKKQIRKYIKFVKRNMSMSMNEVNLWKFIFQCENDV